MIGTRAVYLRCISFANDQKGWVGTLTDAYRMFQTIDGGTTWTFVSNLPNNAPLAICGLYVVNEMVVYASGTNFPYKRFPTRVLKTTDGGETWTAINMEAHASNLIDIFFFNEQEGFVVGGFSQKDDPLYDDVVPVQKSEVRSQKSEVRGKKVKIWWPTIGGGFKSPTNDPQF